MGGSHACPSPILRDARPAAALLRMRAEQAAPFFARHTHSLMVRSGPQGRVSNHGPQASARIAKADARTMTVKARALSLHRQRGRVMAPGSVRGAVAVAAILERAVADPVDRGAGEAVTGGSILDRVGVGETRDHDAGRQHGGRQTGVSPAGVWLAGISIDGHLHPPSWLVPRTPPAPS